MASEGGHGSAMALHGEGREDEETSPPSQTEGGAPAAARRSAIKSVASSSATAPRRADSEFHVKAHGST